MSSMKNVLIEYTHLAGVRNAAARSASNRKGKLETMRPPVLPFDFRPVSTHQNLLHLQLALVVDCCRCDFEISSNFSRTPSSFKAVTAEPKQAVCLEVLQVDINKESRSLARQLYISLSNRY